MPRFSDSRTSMVGGRGGFRGRRRKKSPAPPPGINRARHSSFQRLEEAMMESDDSSSSSSSDVIDNKMDEMEFEEEESSSCWTTTERKGDLKKQQMRSNEEAGSIRVSNIQLQSSDSDPSMSDSLLNDHNTSDSTKDTRKKLEGTVQVDSPTNGSSAEKNQTKQPQPLKSKAIRTQKNQPAKSNIDGGTRRTTPKLTKPKVSKKPLLGQTEEVKVLCVTPFSNSPDSAHDSSASHLHLSPPKEVHASGSKSPASFMKLRGVAIDTRFLQTFEGDAASISFLKQTLAFLKGTARRGSLPHILATTYASVGKHGPNSPKGRQSRITVGTRASILPSDVLTGNHCTNGRDNNSIQEQIWNQLLEPVRIRPPLNAGNVQNRAAVHVPKSLLAHDSWRIFGDLVERIAEEQATQESSLPTKPMDVTIFTSDAAFFAETNVESHKRGLNRFWERIRGHFQTNFMQSLTIVVVETGSIGMPKNQAGDPETNENNPPRAQNDANIPVLVFSPEKIANCTQKIRARIMALSDTDYKKRSTTSGEHASQNPVNIMFKTIPCNPIEFMSIARSWIREVISPASNGGRLSFELPETMDGTQCSILLDLSYTVLPYRLDSPVGIGLLATMKMLSSATVEIIQYMPVSSVDASLIFGVPIVARAGLESDFARYREMQQIVRQLWKYLGSNDIALVLRCKYADDAKEDCWDYTTDDTQLFILMVEDVVERDSLELLHTNMTASPISTKRGHAPANGILYRYASSDQLLRDLNEDGDVFEGDDVETETSKQYAEYIEKSLEFLERGGINPLLLTVNSSNNDSETFERGLLDSSSGNFAKARSDISPASHEIEIGFDGWIEEAGVGVASRVVNANSNAGDRNIDGNGQSGVVFGSAEGNNLDEDQDSTTSDPFSTFADFEYNS